MKKALLLKTALFLLFSLFSMAGEPLNIIDTNMHKILQIIKSKKGDENKENRKKEIGSILDQCFNFVEMSKRAIGKEWKKFTKDQRREFNFLFKQLLKKTYVEKMEMYTNEKIKVGKEMEIGKNKISVNTTLFSSAGEIPIIYKLILKREQWKVYDVNIEGVGLIKNYRSQFTEILLKNSYDNLIQKLQETLND